jgi:hypothetical protein
MLLFFIACLPKKTEVIPPALEVLPPVIELETVVLQQQTIDYSLLFNGLNSQSFYNYLLVDDELMKRVFVEGEILGSNLDNVAIENWTRRVLFSEITRRDSLIIGPIQDLLGYPKDGSLNEHPTASIRNLSFVSSTEEITVIVQRNEGGIMVGIREFDDQESICPFETMLPIGFVEFNGAVQRYSDGAVVAMIQEIVLLPDLEQAVVTEMVDKSNNETLCSAIVDIYLYHEQLSRHSERYYQAAQQAVKLGLEPLYVSSQ